MNWNKFALFAGGVLFGTAGIKILGSKDAKKVYTQTTAAVLRAKDSVMTTYTTVKENAEDILADAKEINEKRAEAEKKTEGIDPELLAKYRAIKQHCARPIAKLYGDQCGGCNMNIPQASLRAFKNGAKMIECENCGRMLIQL